MQLHKPTERFYNLLLEQNYLPTITRPTRICKSSATLIDNILISIKLQDAYKSGIILNDISDHLPSICSLQELKPGRSNTKTIYSRDLSKKNVEKINKQFHQCVLPSVTSVFSDVPMYSSLHINYQRQWQK